MVPRVAFSPLKQLTTAVGSNLDSWGEMEYSATLAAFRECILLVLTILIRTGLSTPMVHRAHYTDENK